MRINVAGLQIDNLIKAEVLGRIEQFVRSGRPHYMVTAYSEFAVMASQNARYHAALNNADLAVPDGIGIIWAAKFQSMPVHNWLTIIGAWLWTLPMIVLSPKSLRTVIKEQVTGRQLVWDIAQLCHKQNFSLALVGGFNGVAQQTANKLKERFPGIKINLVLEPQTFNNQTVQQVAQSNSDILLIAYQPPRQELWLAENLSQLNVKFAVGLGGTFDYISKSRRVPPNFVHYLGLEWLWRLITQPWRAKRMWRAIVQFSLLTLKLRLQKNERTE